MLALFRVFFNSYLQHYERDINISFTERKLRPMEIKQLIPGFCSLVDSQEITQFDYGFYIHVNNSDIKLFPICEVVYLGGKDSFPQFHSLLPL